MDRDKKMMAYLLNRIEGLALCCPAGAPAADRMQATVKKWFEVLRRREGDWRDGDGMRLKRAFDALEERARFWPAPAELLELLPPRRAGGADALGFTPQPRTAEELAEGQRRIREITDRIAGRVAC